MDHIQVKPFEGHTLQQEETATPQQSFAASFKKFKTKIVQAVLFSLVSKIKE
jgi:hypothetical protein